MTESQRIVLNWRAKLKAMGWPDDAIADIIKGLCEAGYRAAIEEIQARAVRTDAIIANAQEVVEMAKKKTLWTTPHVASDRKLLP